jgi:CubicO group peptidase (beta-lactamase class C family)
MITNQTPGLNQPWGLGWMVKPGTFGKKCSARTYGHYGSTGTVAWADPAAQLSLVLLTTKPAAQSRDGLLGPVSDLASEAA